MMWWFIIGCVVGYALGWFDARWGKPPEPLKGTYEHIDDDDDPGNYDFD